MSTATSAVIDRVLDGRYRVESLLAKGGMAAVYSATDLRLDRRVALKVMHAHLAGDDEFVTRFRQEARTAARLSHPHVVSVFDQGEDDDLVFLAMELVEGRTLREVITEHGAHSVRDAVSYLDPVLQALAAAHEAGLAHRDVKPENVLIRSDGMVKVADFGLARAVTAATSSHSSELVWGTAAYLAPEQVERGRTDERSDIYSAGLLFYELLTGVKAFPGDSPVQVAYSHVHGEVPRAAETVATVPAEIEAFIQWACAKDPERRPTDAGAALKELRHSVRQLSDTELDALPGQPVDPDLTQGFDHTRPLRTTDTMAVARQTPQHYARTSGNKPRKTRQPAPAPRRPRRRMKAAGWLLGILLVLIGGTGAGAAWYFTEGPGIHSPVPVLVGLTEADARAALDAEELDPVVELEFSETVTPDTVMAASHDPGVSVRHGTDVTLTVSQGPERYAVPPVVGKTLEQATPMIEDANLTLAEPVLVHDEAIPEGQIVSVEPAEGQSLKPDTEVTVTISQGRQPIEITDVVDQPQADAEQALTDAGFTVVVEEERVFSDSVADGAVVAQSPASGTGFRGDTVTLTVSKGPELFEVPGVIGKQWDEAEKLLTDAGFVVEREDLAGGYFSTVRFQSVDAGEMRPKGTEIVLTVL
ncbi:Stk1 family PASTA domain-containing Ser/Thr kinase [Ornithinimicrobium cryptoxanthini]|uniref:Stk1 family PASTA domain-containing Ser/Thr kinase n=1 Tax=Ornithinimicrobium cryptoxanthini TaxID=2934161 RepID=UPI0021179704|nr:Stk1 family PASTA domain-containing Ser/Thr kinase [Ornithinimicrobium cryptoxanthini]